MYHIFFFIKRMYNASFIRSYVYDGISEKTFEVTNSSHKTYGIWNTRSYLCECRVENYKLGITAVRYLNKSDEIG